MIQAIIFDCFGVIITDALQAVCDELRKTDPEGTKQIKDLIKASNRGFIAPAQSSEQVARILGVTTAEYHSMIADGEHKDQRLLDYIAGLRGSYKTAMLSNIGTASLERRFTAQELTECFDVVIASAEVGHAKPEARVYEITAERLGVPLNACIFVDDRELYLEGARAVGMQTILYKDFSIFTKDLERAINRFEK